MAIIVALALAGCGLATGYRTANMTPDELTKLFDADLCHFYTGNGPATCSTTVTFKTFYPFSTASWASPVFD